MPHRKHWRRVRRFRCLTKQDGKCYYCRCTLRPSVATLDHIHAQKNGGTDNDDNLVACCSHCNSCKGHMSVALFQRKIKSPKHEDPISVWIVCHRRKLNLHAGRCIRHMLAVCR